MGKPNGNEAGRAEPPRQANVFRRHRPLRAGEGVSGAEGKGFDVKPEDETMASLDTLPSPTQTNH